MSSWHGIRESNKSEHAHNRYAHWRAYPCIDPSEIDALLTNVDGNDLLAIHGKLNRVAADTTKGVDEGIARAPLCNMFGNRLGRRTEPALIVQLDP